MRTISLILVLSFAFALCSCKPNNNDFDGTRFSKTRTISVLSEATDPELEKYIRDSVLRDCNINVEFIPYSTYGQPSGVVPDVSYSVDSNILTTYYRMGSVLNISSYVEGYGSSLPYLIDMLGEDNIHYCSDDYSEVWYLKSKRPCIDTRITFIRADWLDKLGLEAPTTREEFHDCLIAFRDNADVLLGEDASKMIPFMVDNEPNVSCKPLLDSFLDTRINELNTFTHGYCRVTQPGYADGLKVLNEWYLEDLLPSDFYAIRPETKESYGPVESGYVGAFCGQCDYLYKNGGNSHIVALQESCGDSASYIAVNTFVNAQGEYAYWSEDYLEERCRYVFMPSTCSDPLACLVYLNWISNPDNIYAMDSIASITAFDHSTLDDYVLTYFGHYPDYGTITSPAYEQALETASEVKSIRVANRCVRQGPSIFPYFTAAGIDYPTVYPGSTSELVCNAIILPEGEFVEVYPDMFEEYVAKGAEIIYSFRISEWEKVINKGDMRPY